jgi:hypothetical protein
MLSFVGLLTTIKNFLGVPIGAAWKSSKDEKDGNVTLDLLNIELISSIVSITKDDICLGLNPIYYKSEEKLDPSSELKLKKITAELNSIIRWAAVDILSFGYSVYELVVKGKDVYLYPVIEKKLKFVLNEKKEVVCFKGDDDSKTALKDTLIFINYDKRSLKPIEDKKHNFEITPKPLQLANVTQGVTELTMIEKSILRYRRDVSKVVRFVTVEVGASQGSNNQDTIDNISSGINSNSISLEGMSADIFDDETPVFPMKKGLGAPKLEEHVSDADISKLADLDYTLSKIFLATRFPKTYADFSTALDASAVSLIRADVRYSKLVISGKSCLEETINNYFASLSIVKKFKVQWKLQEIPNSEDEEVISALSGYQDFLDTAYAYVFEGSETKEEALYKLETYTTLLGDAINLESIEKYITLTRNFINNHFEAIEKPLPGEGEGSDGFDALDEETPEEETPEEETPEEETPEEENSEEQSSEGPEYQPGEKPSFE